MNKGRREKKNSSFFSGLQIPFPPEDYSFKVPLVGYAQVRHSLEMCTGAVQGQESDWV